MKRWLALALALAALGCGGGEAPDADKPATAAAPKKDPSAPDDPNERTNLLDFAHGAVVVSRTGEATLDTSALAAVDGNLVVGWIIPPADLPQSITIALPARSRITRIGYATSPRRNVFAKTVRFESSLDGATFTPLGTLAAERKEKAQQFVNVAAEAKVLRATIVEGDAGATVHELYAQGVALEAPAAPAIDGCWSINAFDASFAQRGAYALGSVSTPGGAVLLDGGSDGRFFRFVWTRGGSFGYAAISADGRHLSGELWNEEPIPLFYNDSWFGTRASGCAPPAGRGDVTRALLAHTGRAPLFGLRFDDAGNLLEAESTETLAALRAFVLGNPSLQARLVAHEFRAATPAANLALAKRQLAGIEQSLARNGVPAGRIAFVAAGSEAPREIPVTDAMRALYSSVDLEIRR